MIVEGMGITESPVEEKETTYMPEGGWLIPVVNDNKQIIV
jgi:hypothetical protein